MLAKFNKKLPIVSLEDIIALMPGSVYWKGLDGCYLGCNDNVLKFLNLPSKEAFIGKTIDELVNEAHAKAVTAVDEAVMRDKKELIVEEPASYLGGQQIFFITQNTFV